MHTRQESTRAWHRPGAGSAGLLWEVLSCSPPSPASTVATWRKGKGHPRGVALQPLEPGWSLPESPLCLYTISPQNSGAIASPRGGRWTLRGGRGPARGHVLGLHLLPHGDTLAGPPRSKGHRAARDAAAHRLWDVQPQGCPRGGRHFSPCPCTPLLFPAWVLRVPGMTPICPLCVQCVLQCPVF